MFSQKRKWLRACLCCLQHDLSVASSCVNFHLLDDNNPYAVAIREDLRVVSDAIKRIRALTDDDGFQFDVSKNA